MEGRFLSISAINLQPQSHLDLVELPISMLEFMGGFHCHRLSKQGNGYYQLLVKLHQYFQRSLI